MSLWFHRKSDKLYEGVLERKWGSTILRVKYPWGTWYDENPIEYDYWAEG